MPYTIYTVLTDNSLPRTRSGGTQFVDITPANPQAEAEAAAIWAARDEPQLYRVMPLRRHRHLDGRAGGALRGIVESRGYAATLPLVTSAQVAKAWDRAAR